MNMMSMLIACVLACTVLIEQAMAQTFATARPTWFQYNQEFIDSNVTAYASSYPWFGGYELWPSSSTHLLDAATITAIKTGSKNLVLFYPPDTAWDTRWAQPRLSPVLSDIDAARAQMVDLTATVGIRAWWNVMPEWDGLGGVSMPNDATQPFTASTRAGMYTNFRTYTSNRTPLWTYLQTPQATRGDYLLSVTDHAPNVHYGYEWGLDMVTMERAIDEVGDIETGIAFLRGAAAQYNKPWGIDMSTWRTGANSNTDYLQSNGRHVGGFSIDYHKRHHYLSYMAGANLIMPEATVLRYADTTLNPYGTMQQTFATFVAAHPTRGTAVVPIALLMDFNHGFEPRHWNNNGSLVWYLRLAYSTGDWAVEHLFNQLWPGYMRHGLTTGWNATPSAPVTWNTYEDFQTWNAIPANATIWNGRWTDSAAFLTWMQAGNDSRPFEPMPTSTYGNLFDVLLSNAPIEAFNRYSVVMPIGDFAMTPALNTSLTTYATGGGIVVLNASQVTSADETLLGVSLGSTTTSTSSKWGAETTLSESSYTYRIVTPTTATVIATNPANGQPLITMRTVGSGKVYFVTPLYMQDTAHTLLLNIAIRFLSDLTATQQQGWVTGAAVDFLTTRGTGFTTVTVANHSASTWSGTVTMNVNAVIAATEWLTAATFTPTTSGATSTIAVTVPAYDIRVFAMTGTNTGGTLDVIPPSAPTNVRIVRHHTHGDR